MKWLGLALNYRPGRYAIRIGHQYFGVERSTIKINGLPYMTRWIMYCGPIGFRLHKFYRGDDDRAPHDHPFWFVTIPLGTGYWEWVHYVVNNEWAPRLEYVAPWRPHFRPASHKHIVAGPLTGSGRPFWTFCIFGFTQPHWGFWPTPDTFVHFMDWEEYNAAY